MNNIHDFSTSPSFFEGEAALAAGCGDNENKSKDVLRTAVSRWACRFDDYSLSGSKFEIVGIDCRDTLFGKQSGSAG